MSESEFPFEIDLRAAAIELAADPCARGRRQKLICNDGRLKVVLFAFEAGAGLAEHVARGIVTIHVLGGRLRVKAAGIEHDLVASKLLVLAPGVRHDVMAEEPSTMLLQIYLEGAAAGTKQ